VSAERPVRVGRGIRIPVFVFAGEKESRPVHEIESGHIVDVPVSVVVHAVEIPFVEAPVPVDVFRLVDRDGRLQVGVVGINAAVEDADPHRGVPARYVPGLPGTNHVQMVETVGQRIGHGRSHAGHRCRPRPRKD
jgi:hypothetical protein